ncbi:MAG TPA: peptidylprolyl isomerase [Flavobacteriaceae bacterium]|nr:peptidylprolyl isomerase [Flavobacteriaceae bacterium]MCB9212428.1 peptidylprolyl isomerase [Alteromonas sp.]HPF11704.1 peptidylprolyl isomerase [Flavobacteriaceae bacterium]HQU20179.1 peptidylprolyl isomerase [Flavobacteriaceae bacterium]HQU64732.1 peptidylprolyl isomerase [Flavobacteriaceae bacterium]
MKKIFLLIALAALTLSSCKSKYPNLEKGIYAEFVTNKGTFVAKFYDKAAPLTVANFIELAEGKHPLVDSTYKGKPFFTGLTFHRVIKDFMIQGGDPKGDGTGNPGYKFPDEFVDSLKFDRKGLLAMANSGPETNGSQFFITLKETPWLDGRHTIFGEIVLGQEIVDSIGSVATTKPNDKPETPVIINEVNIINKGVQPASFSAEMEKIEKAKREKEARIASIAENTANDLEKLKEEAQEYPSGLKIYWNHKGKGVKPADGSTVKMNYAGYFADGRLFDTSLLEIAEKYEAVDKERLARGQYAPLPSVYSKEARLIPGFKEGLLEMSIGDKATLFIPSHLAYGEQGAGDVIPPNSDLIFELELVGIDE